MTPADEAKVETWHFLDKRSKAVVSIDGLKLEFASHSDAVLGKHVLNDLASRIAIIADHNATNQATVARAEDVVGYGVDEVAEIVSGWKTKYTAAEAALAAANDRLAEVEAERDEIAGSLEFVCAGHVALEARLATVEGALDEAVKALLVAKADFEGGQEISEKDYDYLGDMSQDCYNNAVYAIRRIDKTLATLAAIKQPPAAPEPEALT